ncbi:MAG TPA: threonine ammonia-lyase IlvA, partial [Bacteroidia bacterium]
MKTSCAFVKAIPIEKFLSAKEKLKNVAGPTPLQKNEFLSKKFGANIYLKREDLQVVRSFKIRGAFNKIVSLGDEAKNRSVVCASAGNHAQGVAYTCALLGIHGTIFMPLPTPNQKVEQVRWFGKEFIDVRLAKDTFDDCCERALGFARQSGSIFIHPFDDEEVIAGQGTAALEMLEQLSSGIDYIFMPIGGGGLASGVASVFEERSPETKLIGVEPEGAASMKRSFDMGKIVALDTVDRFADGAAVKRAGELTFSLCKKLLNEIAVVPEGKICTTILELYNRNAIIAEPAGALPVAALDFFKEKIKGKNVVCVISGGNNDIGRM